MLNHELKMKTRKRRIHVRVDRRGSAPFPERSLGLSTLYEPCGLLHAEE